MQDAAAAVLPAPRLRGGHARAPDRPSHARRGGPVARVLPGAGRGGPHDGHGLRAADQGHPAPRAAGPPADHVERYVAHQSVGHRGGVFIFYREF